MRCKSRENQTLIKEESSVAKAVREFGGGDTRTVENS